MSTLPFLWSEDGDNLFVGQNLVFSKKTEKFQFVNYSKVEALKYFQKECASYSEVTGWLNNDLLITVSNSPDPSDSKSELDCKSPVQAIISWNYSNNTIKEHYLTKKDANLYQIGYLKKMAKILFTDINSNKEKSLWVLDLKSDKITEITKLSGLGVGPIGDQADDFYSSDDESLALWLAESWGADGLYGYRGAYLYSVGSKKLVDLKKFFPEIWKNIAYLPYEIFKVYSDGKIVVEKDPALKGTSSGVVDVYLIDPTKNSLEKILNKVSQLTAI